MCKRLIYNLFLFIFFTSCEEIYTPAMDRIEGQLVVESLITNDPAQNFVHLTRTSSFYDQMPPKEVAGAKASLIQLNGAVVHGIEKNAGYFNFNMVPVSGLSYKLQIVYNNDTYESEVVTMPPVPVINRFYTDHIVKKLYVNDGSGNPLAYNLSGRELYVDVPNTTELSHYRFKARAILEWYFLPPPPPFPPLLPPIYGWDSYCEKGNFIIAGPGKYTKVGIIEKQPFLMLNYDAKQMLNSEGKPVQKPDSISVTIPLGWIIILQEYGTSKGSYDFHEQLNKQFAATGNLFDPVETQIYGNIVCKTDTSKVAFGYFDLNSYNQFRYYLFFNNTITDVFQRQIFKYPYIPERGHKDLGFTDVLPDWWE